MAITLRNVKGSTLSYLEMDTNFSSYFTSASVTFDNKLQLHFPLSPYSPAVNPMSITLPPAPIGNTITQGITEIAPSQDAVYTALQGKADIVLGKVPIAQIPATAINTVTAANLAGFPGTGTVGVIYVAEDTRLIYYWNGSAYIQIAVPSSFTAGSGINITSGVISNAGVTSVGGTGTVSGLTLTGGVTTTGNLTLGGALTLQGATGGTVNGNITANGFFNSSDITLKNVIDRTFDTTQIEAITYTWKDSSDQKERVGYSAQQVQQYMPDAVSEENGKLVLNYIDVLVAKVSALEKRVQELEAKL